MITGLHTTWCQVSDMKRSLAFYRDVLGLKVVIESPYWSQLDLGNGMRGLHPALKGFSPPFGEYGKGWMLGLETSDINALRERLTAAGAAVIGELHDVPGGVVLDFSDPDGNPIEAWQKK